MDLDQMIEPDLTLIPTLRAIFSGLGFWRYLQTATDDGTIPLTVLLELEDVLPDFSTRQILEIHIIGATDFELIALVCFEELLH